VATPDILADGTRRHHELRSPWRMKMVLVVNLLVCPVGVAQWSWLIGAA
jgi:hypothetical protein